MLSLCVAYESLLMLAQGWRAALATVSGARGPPGSTSTPSPPNPSHHCCRPLSWGEAAVITHTHTHNHITTRYSCISSPLLAALQCFPLIHSSVSISGNIHSTLYTDYHKKLFLTIVERQCNAKINVIGWGLTRIVQILNTHTTDLFPAGASWKYSAQNTIIIQVFCKVSRTAFLILFYPQHSL